MGKSHASQYANFGSLPIVLILNGDIRLFIPNTKVIEVKNSVTAKNYYWKYVKNVNLPFSDGKTIVQSRFSSLIPQRFM